MDYIYHIYVILVVPGLMLASFIGLQSIALPANSVFGQAETNANSNTSSTNTTL